MSQIVFGIMVLSIVYFVALLFRSIRRSRTALKNIPGPKPHFLLGNIPDFGNSRPLRLKQWAAEYGELFKLRLGWENWVFVNSPEAVKEIFDRQSQHTSSRAPSPVVSDLVSGNMRFLLMPYGPEWRSLRAVVHKLLTPKASDTFKPSQEYEAKQLLWDILTDNQDQESFYMHIRRYTTSVVMTSTYGRRVPKWECDDVHQIYKVMQDFTEIATPGAYLAESFPPLAKLPVFLQWWRASAQAAFHRQAAVWMNYWTTLQKQIDEKKAPPCFVKQFVETDYQKQNISELQAAFVAGSMIEAGSETTSSALNTCVKYLAAYPEAQANAYAELRKVVGEGRLPSYADEDALPYIRACVKETLRIRPVTNIGSPHYTTSDITYKGILIPKNTVVSINQYALHFDPARYEDPEAFIPDRYLNHPLKAGAYAVHPDPYARDHFDFGAGRRACPGLHLAENSLFITIAMIVWAFEILPPLEDNGKVGTVDVSDEAYDESANTLPKPYKLRFVPRSPAVEQLIRSEWSKAQKEGYWLRDVKVNQDGMVVSNA